VKQAINPLPPAICAAVKQLNAIDKPGRTARPIFTEMLWRLFRILS